MDWAIALRIVPRSGHPGPLNFVMMYTWYLFGKDVDPQAFLCAGECPLHKLHRIRHHLVLILYHVLHHSLKSIKASHIPRSMNFEVCMANHMLSRLSLAPIMLTILFVGKAAILILPLDLDDDVYPEGSNSACSILEVLVVLIGHDI